MEDSPVVKEVKKPRAPRVVKPRVPRVTKEGIGEEHQPSVAPRRSERPYYSGVGRRKEAVALVRLYANGHGEIMVGTRPMRERFPTVELQEVIISPLRAAGQEGAVDISIHVSGGGTRGQADAIRLGVARALLKLNPLFRKALKKEGYLRRDARVKERKKYGLKRARRAPQWQKR